MFATCALDPRRLAPCPSIIPARHDAVDELDRCVARGARILKIHPPTQGFDPGNPRHLPFFRRCAHHGVLVLVHTGHERSAPVLDPALGDPARLRPALEAGCRVVAAHSGSGRPTDEPDCLPAFVAMVRAHANLFGDTSILCTPGRERDLGRLLDDAAVRARLVHGSDYPFPAVPAGFRAQLGDRRALALTAEANLLRRDLALKTELGLGDSAALAHRLLHA